MNQYKVYKAIDHLNYKALKKKLLIVVRHKKISLRKNLI